MSADWWAVAMADPSVSLWVDLMVASLVASMVDSMAFLWAVGTADS